MNLASGQSAIKQHLRNGAVTSCNRKTSGISTNEFADFKWWAEKYPNVCCQKCLSRFVEKSKNLPKIK